MVENTLALRAKVEIGQNVSVPTHLSNATKTRGQQRMGRRRGDVHFMTQTSRIFHVSQLDAPNHATLNFAQKIDSHATVTGERYEEDDVERGFKTSVERRLPRQD